MSTAPDRFARAFGDWTPRAVVFDCDGLLLDTESSWYRAQDAVVAELDALLTAKDDENLHGSTIETAARIIAEADVVVVNRTAANADALVAIQARATVNMPLIEKGGVVGLLGADFVRSRLKRIATRKADQL